MFSILFQFMHEDGGDTQHEDADTVEFSESGAEIEHEDDEMAEDAGDGV